MYVGFELHSYKHLGKHVVSEEEKTEFKEQIEWRFNKLSDYLLDGYSNTLNANTIAEHLFPEKKCHIFLSHSHADEQVAIEFAAGMRKIGIEVFVDSCVWGYAQDLTDKINEKFASSQKLADRVTFEYYAATNNIINISTILNSALQRMIQKCEAFVFLRTENSVPITDYPVSDLTLSPWIYSELQFSSLVEITGKNRVSLEKFETTASINKRSSDISFAHKIMNEHLVKIDAPELTNWYSNNTERGIDALDSLYATLDIEDKFNELRLARLRTQK